MEWTIIPPEGEIFYITAADERDARKMARYCMGRGKLPKGTLVYPTNQNPYLGS